MLKVYVRSNNKNGYIKIRERKKIKRERKRIKKWVTEHSEKVKQLIGFF